MNKFILLLSLLCWIFPGRNGDMTLEINGIKTIQGELYVSLFNKESFYMNIDSSYRRVIVPVTENPQRIVISDLSEGDYAIAIFQDLNGNGSLDVNDLHIPKEPYGFSNNLKGLHGPATYKQALFHFYGSDTVNIKLVNSPFTSNKESHDKSK